MDGGRWGQCVTDNTVTPCVYAYKYVRMHTHTHNDITLAEKMCQSERKYNTFTLLHIASMGYNHVAVLPSFSFFQCCYTHAYAQKYIHTYVHTRYSNPWFERHSCIPIGHGRSKVKVQVPYHLHPPPLVPRRLWVTFTWSPTRNP